MMDENGSFLFNKEFTINVNYGFRISSTQLKDFPEPPIRFTVERASYYKLLIIEF